MENVFYNLPLLWSIKSNIVMIIMMITHSFNTHPGGSNPHSSPSNPYPNPYPLP